MPPDDPRRDASDGRDQRLRIDSEKVDVARLRLAAIDRVIFVAGGRHSVDAHDGLVRQTIAKLFGHG